MGVREGGGDKETKRQKEKERGEIGVQSEQVKG